MNQLTPEEITAAFRADYREWWVRLGDKYFPKLKLYKWLRSKYSMTIHPDILKVTTENPTWLKDLEKDPWQKDSGITVDKLK